MCGVVGIVRKDGDVAPDLYVATIKLQHRAHDMAGIATSHMNDTFRERGMGEVAVAFSKEKLENLKGCVGIGHVRWTTMGDSNLRNAHPISGFFRGKKFYIGHNGQLTQQDELRERFSNYRPNITTDTKFIAALISFSGQDTFENALHYACSILKGTYSLVILYDNIVYAVRDTSGNRPLVIGINGRALMVASETVAFNPLGGRYIDEVNPGEIIKITQCPFEYTRIPIRHVPEEMPRNLRFCLFEMIYLLHPASTFLGRTVQLVRERMGRYLFEEHPLDADVVIGVPDSGLAAARGYSRASGYIPKESGIIRSHYAGRVFMEAVAERGQKHLIKHDVIPEIISGKRVIVVDDSIVEGLTSQKIVALLRANGAQKIYFLSSSPPPVVPCYYGVPTALSQRRLIAADHAGDREKIRNELRADYLGYLSLESTIRAVIQTPSVIVNYPQLSMNDFCTACFSKIYPIPL